MWDHEAGSPLPNEELGVIVVPIPVRDHEAGSPLPNEELLGGRGPQRTDRASSMEDFKPDQAREGGGGDDGEAGSAFSKPWFI
jgi:hypothetical protein